MPKRAVVCAHGVIRYKCPLCEREYHRGYRARTGIQAYENLKKRLWAHGLSLDEFHSMYEAQKEACAICREWMAPFAPHIDHDHESGKVRQLLCRMCNLALGIVQDNPVILRRAATYLERHGGWLS